MSNDVVGRDPSRPTLMILKDGADRRQQDNDLLVPEQPAAWTPQHSREPWHITVRDLQHEARAVAIGGIAGVAGTQRCPAHPCRPTLDEFISLVAIRERQC